MGFSQHPKLKVTAMALSSPGGGMMRREGHDARKYLMRVGDQETRNSDVTTLVVIRALAWILVLLCCLSGPFFRMLIDDSHFFRMLIDDSHFFRMLIDDSHFFRMLTEDSHFFRMLSGEPSFLSNLPDDDSSCLSKLPDGSSVSMTDDCLVCKSDFRLRDAVGTTVFWPHFLTMFHMDTLVNKVTMHPTNVLLMKRKCGIRSASANVYRQMTTFLLNSSCTLAAAA